MWFFQRAQVAIGAITISAVRELDVDFSKPFMDFKVSLLMQKEKEQVNLFVFLQPFERNVWLSTLAVVSITSLSPVGDFVSLISDWNEDEYTNNILITGKFFKIVLKVCHGGTLSQLTFAIGKLFLWTKNNKNAFFLYPHPFDS